ncbi:hypothetical protein [Solirhodobacter olei]|nr:hypothetical protein [Solirhodobacter olei]
MIFLTANARQEDLDRLADVHAVAILPKPFDPMTLADQVHEIWMNLA